MQANTETISPQLKAITFIALLASCVGLISAITCVLKILSS